MSHILRSNLTWTRVWYFPAIISYEIFFCIFLLRAKSQLSWFNFFWLWFIKDLYRRTILGLIKLFSVNHDECRTSYDVSMYYVVFGFNAMAFLVYRSFLFFSTIILRDRSLFISRGRRQNVNLEWANITDPPPFKLC